MPGLIGSAAVASFPPHFPCWHRPSPICRTRLNHWGHIQIHQSQRINPMLAKELSKYTFRDTYLESVYSDSPTIPLGRGGQLLSKIWVLLFLDPQPGCCIPASQWDVALWQWLWVRVGCHRCQTSSQEILPMNALYALSLRSDWVVSTLRWSLKLRLKEDRCPLAWVFN